MKSRSYSRTIYFPTMYHSCFQKCNQNSFTFWEYSSKWQITSGFIALDFHLNLLISSYFYIYCYKVCFHIWSIEHHSTCHGLLGTDTKGILGLSGQEDGCTVLATGKQVRHSEMRFKFCSVYFQLKLNTYTTFLDKAS